MTRRPQTTRLLGGYLGVLLAMTSWSAAQTALAADSAEEAGPAAVSVAQGEARVMNFERRISRVAIADPAVADYRLISPTELYILGKQVGTTNLLLWQTDASPITMPVDVGLNVAPLRASLAQLLPGEQDIQVSSSGHTVIVSGSVADVVVAETVVRVVQAFTTTTGKAGDTPTERLVNLLKVRSPQQVMLQVRIAEVSESLIDRLGFEWAQGEGSVRGSLMSGFVSDATIGALFRGAVDLTAGNASAGTALGVEAERQDTLIKILAEPTIVAMSGQEGSFLVGGKVYIPVAQGLGSTSIEERSYGVGIRFVPTVLDGGRISLKVSPEVSEPIAKAVTAGGTSLPSFKTSTVSTTVQMQEGQNLVIGGLLRDNITEAVRAIPVLGEIPLLGSLFRRSESITERSELLVVVRPILVRSTDQTPTLPTDTFVAPSRGEFLLGGTLDSGTAAATSATTQAVEAQRLESPPATGSLPQASALLEDVAASRVSKESSAPRSEARPSPR